MANLSDLLNPAPTDEGASEQHRDSSPSSQFPANPYAPLDGGEQHSATTTGLSSAVEGDAVYASQWHRPSDPPPMPHDAANSLARRMSAFGDGSFTSLPRAGDVIRRMSSTSHETHNQFAQLPESQTLRKMSSPSLEQYHMSSRSPEQVRRASIVEVANPSFTLAPLQYSSGLTPLSQSQTQQQPQEQEHATSPASHALESFETKSEEIQRPNEGLLDPADPMLSVNAQVPGDGQPKTESQDVDMPSSTSLTTADSLPPALMQPVPASTEVVPPLIKSETTASAHDSIPAFIPVAPIKREHVAVPPSSAESPGPIPTIEETPATESRGTKRPAPKSATKKGVAKKGPPSKKQKTGVAAEPTSKSKAKSRAKLDKSLSAAATPLDASPAPRSAGAGSIAGRSSASPTVAGMTDDEDQGEDDDTGSPDPDAEVYCICRRPDTGTFMIGCDGKCDGWYHGKCVDILEKDKNLIDRYICPICTKNGVGVTTWKRMCRREGCRMPARLAKRDEEPSKYCSDECGVTFFRDQMGKTRGATDGKKSSRKLESLAVDDLGPRGGVIHAHELKALVTSASTFEDFKKLGDGVLSPPATPSPTQSKRKGVATDADEYLDESQAQRLKDIQTRKDELRVRHTLLKDQTKMINLARQTGIRTAESKGLKPKDLCGYDDLVHLSEADFARWRESAEGQATLKAGILDAGKDGEGDTEMINDKDAQTAPRASGPCMKKKCLKHSEWFKLALETNRSETMENSETMRALEREERDIKERAGLKARQIKSGDLGGYVEHHNPGYGLGISNSVDDAGTTGVNGGTLKATAADAVGVDLNAIRTPTESMTNEGHDAAMDTATSA